MSISWCLQIEDEFNVPIALSAFRDNGAYRGLSPVFTPGGEEGKLLEGGCVLTALVGLVNYVWARRLCQTHLLGSKLTPDGIHTPGLSPTHPATTRSLYPLPPAPTPLPSPSLPFLSATHTHTHTHADTRIGVKNRTCRYTALHVIQSVG